VRARWLTAVAVLALVAVIAGIAVASGSGARSPADIVLIYNGPSIANTHAAPDLAAFTTWCNSECAPSVALPMADASSGDVEGTIYVWTKHFVTSADGQTLCFGEFTWAALRSGDIYMHSGSNGTCGGFMNVEIKPPNHVPAAAGQVVGGGGDGVLVGGTGKYSKATGTYTDRVFVELNFAGGPNWYDQLFWSIHRN
jgi:hypothetical protein